MLAKIGGFKPQETIFEVGGKGKQTHNRAAEVMKTFRGRRWGLHAGPRHPRRPTSRGGVMASLLRGAQMSTATATARRLGMRGLQSVLPRRTRRRRMHPDDDELVVTVSSSSAPRDALVVQRRGRVHVLHAADHQHGGGAGVRSALGRAAAAGLRGGSARRQPMDLHNDEVAKSFGMPTRQKMRWDRKGAKYVSTANDEDGSPRRRQPHDPRRERRQDRGELPERALRPVAAGQPPGPAAAGGRERAARGRAADAGRRPLPPQDGEGAQGC